MNIISRKYQRYQILDSNGNGLFDTYNGYINSLEFYFFHFQKVPNVIRIDGVNSDSIDNYITENKQNEVLSKYSKADYDSERNLKTIHSIWLLKNDILIEILEKRATIHFRPESESIAKGFMEIIRGYTIVANKVKPVMHHIWLITQEYSKFNLKELKVSNPKLKISRNYNDDLLPVHQSIMKNLKKTNKSGILLLYGSPGTGKSTYIRQLIHSQKKKVLYMSPRIARNIDLPEFTNLLLENPDSIIVIEDAEDILISRDESGYSGIAMLLNLTDGLLGDSLGIQIIATFNTNISNVDKALLRKGRLIAIYEFKPLCLEKTVLLLKELGKKTDNNIKPMTLADIYNMDEVDYNININKRPKIGF